MTAFTVQPTVLDGVSNDAAGSQEEIFGRQLTVLHFERENEALRIANASRYGVAASICTGEVHGPEDDLDQAVNRHEEEER